MVLVLMIRENISDYRREFARPYYHDNSLIRCTETWSLAWIYLVDVGSSLKIYLRLLGQFVITPGTLVSNNY
jgi:hypothetical protein